MKKIHDGDRVRVALGKSKVTNKELAEKIGVAPSTLSRMLNEPSWRTDYLELAGETLSLNFFSDYYGSMEKRLPIIGILLDPHSLTVADILALFENGR